MSRWLEKQKQLEEKEQQAQAKPALLLGEYTDSIPEHPTTPTSPDQLYTWVAGDNIWQVARRLNFDPYHLLEHNDIEDYNSIEPGTRLHLPEPRPVSSRRPITYEVFPVPRIMHVIQEGGSHKLMFANVTKWSDIKPTGALYPKNRNVTVHGLARVPIEDDEAVFYMDELALGDCINGGRIRYAIGFNHTHLSEGSVTQEADQPKPIVSKVIQKTIDRLEAQIAADALEEGVGNNKFNRDEPIAPQVSPNIYKTTFKPFNENRKPVLFYTPEPLVVIDFDTVRPSKSFSAGTQFTILGTFVKDGKTYGRPSNTQYWFGIPMDKILPVDDVDDDEEYSYDIDLSDRVAMGRRGRLTNKERYVTVPSLKIASTYVKVRTWVKNKQNKEQ